MNHLTFDYFLAWILVKRLPVLNISFLIVSTIDFLPGKNYVNTEHCCFPATLGYCRPREVSKPGKCSHITSLVQCVYTKHTSSTFLIFLSSTFSRFRAITKSYLRRVDGVILMYDVTRESSFRNIRDWIQSIEVNQTPS